MLIEFFLVLWVALLANFSSFLTMLGHSANNALNLDRERNQTSLSLAALAKKGLAVHWFNSASSAKLVLMPSREFTLSFWTDKSSTAPRRAERSKLLASGIVSLVCAPPLRPPARPLTHSLTCAALDKKHPVGRNKLVQNHPALPVKPLVQVKHNRPNETTVAIGEEAALQHHVTGYVKHHIVFQIGWEVCLQKANFINSLLILLDVVEVGSDTLLELQRDALVGQKPFDSFLLVGNIVLGNVDRMDERRHVGNNGGAKRSSKGSNQAGKNRLVLVLGINVPVPDRCERCKGPV